MKDKYYIYKVYLGKDVVYVGKGKGKRYQHYLSGCSHNDKLNEIYFRHKLLGETKPVVKVTPMFDEDMALSAEHMYIRLDNPVCNKDLKTTTPEWYKCPEDECIRNFVFEELPFTNCHWRNLLQFTNLSDRQLKEVYDNVCEYSNVNLFNILCIAVYSSIIYNVKVSCELVNALVVCRDYVEGV